MEYGKSKIHTDVEFTFSNNKWLKNFKKGVDKPIGFVVSYYPLPHKRPLNKNCRNIVNKRIVRQRTLITK